MLKGSLVHNCRRLGQLPGKLIDHPSVWSGKDYPDQTGDWVHRFTEEEVQELEAAVARVRATGKDLKVSVSGSSRWNSFEDPAGLAGM
jgi:hypothetical protein